ncbi:hypothetical protein FIBSPDRAFT_886295 [Athelia psychrophila]|uniref:Uncharacterized protein n=1 Tax=Athelia psychrophila TaxID=1759441 RepID=A0A166QZK4_9AGAM|nr:hypothetical protein FIBSPDRAFT_886295 [Fibularhizoctonia sp. CBS 109695]
MTQQLSIHPRMLTPHTMVTVFNTTGTQGQAEVHNVNGSHVTIYNGPVYNYTICDCNHACRNHPAVDTAGAGCMELLSATACCVAFMKILVISLIWFIYYL